MILFYGQKFPQLDYVFLIKGSWLRKLERTRDRRRHRIEFLEHRAYSKATTVTEAMKK